jgi:hypothetical protein
MYWVQPLGAFIKPAKPAEPQMPFGKPQSQWTDQEIAIIAAQQAWVIEQLKTRREQLTMSTVCATVRASLHDPGNAA